MERPDQFFGNRSPLSPIGYFQGDTGEGLGASHQTGWTGVVAKLIQIFASLDSKTFLEAAEAH